MSLLIEADDDLFGANGRNRSVSTRKEALALPITIPIGSPGQYNHGGHVYNDDVKKLQGLQARREWQSMSRESHVVSAVLLAIEMIFRNITWEVANENPYTSGNEKDEKPGNEQDKDFLSSVLFEDMDNTKFAEFVSDSLSMLIYGFTWHEITFKRRMGGKGSMFTDGMYGIKDLALRPQITIHRWDVAPDGEVRGVIQSGTRGIISGQLYIPMERSLYMLSQRDNNNVEGRSLLRGAWNSWNYVRNLEEIEKIGIERNLNGLPMVRMPQQIINAAQDGDENALAAVAEYKKIAQDVRKNKDGSIIIPSDTFVTPDGQQTANPLYTIELLSGGGTTNEVQAAQTIERHQFAIAQSILADFITIGSAGGGGSYALVADKRSFFELAIMGWARTIATAINDTLIPRLWKLNGKNLHERPYIKHGRIREEDVDRLVGVIANLSKSGMQIFPDNNLEKFLRNILKIPQRDPNDIIPQDPQMQMQAQAQDAQQLSQLSQIFMQKEGTDGQLAQSGQAQDQQFGLQAQQTERQLALQEKQADQQHGLAAQQQGVTQQQAEQQIKLQAKQQDADKKREARQGTQKHRLDINQRTQKGNDDRKNRKQAFKTQQDDRAKRQKDTAKTKTIKKADIFGSNSN